MKKIQNKAQFIGSQIKKAREDKGLSQFDLAKELGFESATAISLIENGERKVTAENLEKIANFLQIDIQSLLGIDTEKMDVSVALRAEKDISKEDQDAILHFIELAKRKRNGK